MTPETPPDLKVALVMLACLAVAWGPVFLTIAIGLVLGFADARRARLEQGAKPQG